MMSAVSARTSNRLRKTLIFSGCTLVTRGPVWAETLYAIVAQHVMRGGEDRGVLDPNADSMVSRSNQGNLVPARHELRARAWKAGSWGVDFDPNLVLTDS